MDADFTVAEALAVRDGRILAVGSDADIRNAHRFRTLEVIEMAGKTVVPGLADNHLHGAGGGDGVDLSRVRTMDELLGAIAERARTSGAGELVATNSDWHEGQLQEQRLPLRRDLDEAAPGNPVVVVRGGHEYILNSQALEKWEITTDTPVPDGGRITRYPGGELNGELVDTAKRLVTMPERPSRGSRNPHPGPGRAVPDPPLRGPDQRPSSREQPRAVPAARGDEAAGTAHHAGDLPDAHARSHRG